MARQIKVKLQKLDNQGVPMEENGKPVLASHDPATADNIMRGKKVKWIVHEDPRETEDKPKEKRKLKEDEKSDSTNKEA